MSRRDFQRRERKKTKKEEKKVVASVPITTTPMVQVIPKRKPSKGPEE